MKYISDDRNYLIEIEKVNNFFTFDGEGRNFYNIIFEDSISHNKKIINTDYIELIELQDCIEYFLYNLNNPLSEIYFNFKLKNQSPILCNKVIELTRDNNPLSNNIYLKLFDYILESNDGYLNQILVIKVNDIIDKILNELYFIEHNDCSIVI